MTIYRAPVRDMHFLLDDVLKIDRFDNLPGFSDASRDVRNAILSEAARLGEEVMHPLTPAAISTAAYAVRMPASPPRQDFARPMRSSAQAAGSA